MTMKHLQVHHAQLLKRYEFQMIDSISMVELSHLAILSEAAGLDV